MEETGFEEFVETLRRIRSRDPDFRMDIIANSVVLSERQRKRLEDEFEKKKIDIHSGYDFERDSF